MQLVKIKLKGLPPRTKVTGLAPRLGCRACDERGGYVSTIVDAHRETPGERWERETRE
jgi:hypothetical protein